MNRFFVVSVAAAAMLCSCDRFLIDDIESVSKRREDIVLTKVQQEIIPATRDFTFDLIRLVCKPESENVFISPFSLQTALAMASAGADGTTRDEINAAIGLKGFSTEDVASLYKTLVPALKDVDNTVTVSIANSVWARKDAGMKDGYSKMMRDSYKASVHMLGDDSASSINKWVKKETNGMIKRLDVNLSEAEMLLLNALYFNGRWADPFSKDDSRPDTFTDYAGKESQVTFMYKRSSMSYYYSDVMSAVNIPYGNGAYRMTVVIPTDENHDIDEVLGLLDENTWSRIVGTHQFGKVDLLMPKFEAEYGASFVKILKQLGISQAFTNYADFSLMAEKSLKISDVAQKSMIKVDEKGTEAVSVTMIPLGPTSAGPDRDVFNFKVDTPFFYAISEVSTGTILFAGVQKWM